MAEQGLCPFLEFPVPFPGQNLIQPRLYLVLDAHPCSPHGFSVVEGEHDGFDVLTHGNSSLFAMNYNFLHGY